MFDVRSEFTVGSYMARSWSVVLVPVGSLVVSSCFADCSKIARSLCTMCSWFVRSVFVVGSQFVRKLSIVSSWFIRIMLICFS